MLLLKRLSSTLAQTPKSTIAQIYAFKSRSGMDLEQSTLSQALTLSPNQETGENERLAMLGESCLSLFTTEYLFQKYPSMPAPVLKSLCKAYVGSGALRSVGLGFGVQNVMEIKKELDDKQKEMVVGLVLKSLIGAFYKEKVCVQLIQGAIATRTFIHKHFLSRNVEAGDHLHYIIKRPRALLIKVAEKLNKKRPIARILKESGRASNNAVYVVGLFIGSEKISEGYGDSLAMAEIRATKRALEDHFLQEVKDISLPSDDLLDESKITFFDKEEMAALA